MTELTVSFEEWMRHYCLQLAESGVGAADASFSALAGWHLQEIDQTCFPDSGLRAPVHFIVHEPFQEPGRNRFASFSTSPERYLLYPVHMTDKVKSRCDAAAYDATGIREVTRAIVSLAAHEVRHRVQIRLPNLRLYGAGAPPRDPFARASYEVAAASFDGDSPEPAREFDARVVEELVYDRFTELRNPGLIAAIVLAGAAS